MLRKIVSITLGALIAFSVYSEPLNGIYVGILEFSGTIQELTPEFVFLDPSGKQQLLNYIDNYHPLPTPGSAYYYAVHKALVNVEDYKKNSQLPQTTTTTLISITDGLDTASTNPGLAELPDLSLSSGGYNRGNLAQYHLYITQLLDEKKVNMTSLEIAGADTYFPFQQNSSLANKNFNESIVDIVNSMGFAANNPRITFTMPSAVYPIGTQLRIVFDGQSAANSRKYIEGKLSNSNGGYSLTDVKAHGINLDAQQLSGIPGTQSQIGITYEITVNDAINQSLVRQWYIQPSTLGRTSQNWIPDTEFGAITITEYGLNTAPQKNSAIVYLILDGSPSLSGGRTVEQIRSRAKSVVNQLYNAVSNPAQ